MMRKATKNLMKNLVMLSQITRLSQINRSYGTEIFSNFFLKILDFKLLKKFFIFVI
jgi:hypothetical protein